MSEEQRTADQRVDPSTCRHVFLTEEFKESDWPNAAPGGFMRSVCRICGARMSEYKTPEELKSYGN